MELFTLNPIVQASDPTAELDMGTWRQLHILPGQVQVKRAGLVAQV